MRTIAARVLLSVSACCGVSLHAVAACAEDQPRLVELRVTSDRGEGFDRLYRIRVHADGCVAVRRPPFHRQPGRFSARLDAASLQSMQRLAGDARLRASAPERAMREAKAAREQRAQAEGELQRTYVSHPTGYALRLYAEGVPVELKAESIFQQAALYPESAELAALAAAVEDVLALDGLPDLVAEAQP
jgi:hypothetical protein